MKRPFSLREKDRMREIKQRLESPTAMFVLIAVPSANTGDFLLRGQKKVHQRKGRPETTPRYAGSPALLAGLGRSLTRP